MKYKFVKNTNYTHTMNKYYLLQWSGTMLKCNPETIKSSLYYIWLNEYLIGNESSTLDEIDKLLFKCYKCINSSNDVDSNLVEEIDNYINENSIKFVNPF